MSRFKKQQQQQQREQRRKQLQRQRQKARGQREQRQREKQEQRTREQRERDQARQDLRNAEIEEKRQREQDQRDKNETLRDKLRKIAYTVNRQAKIMIEFEIDNEIEVPAVRDLMNSGGYITLKVSDEDLLSEYIRAQNFMNDPTHTKKGMREFMKTLASQKDLFRIMRKLGEMYPRINTEIDLYYEVRDNWVQPMINENRYTWEYIFETVAKNMDSIIARVEANRQKFHNAFDMG